MSSTDSLELVSSVYSFLVSSGHSSTAKALAKEAKIEESKLKNSKEDLKKIFESYKAQKRPISQISKSEGSDSDDDSDDDSSEDEAPPVKKPTPAPAKKQDESSSDDDSSEDEAPLAKKAVPTPAKKPVPAPAKMQEESSSDDDSSEDEAPPAKKPVPTPAKKQVESSSDDDSSDDESSEDEAPPAKKPVPTPAKKQEESSSDDDSSEDEAPPAKKPASAPVQPKKPVVKAVAEEEVGDDEDSTEPTGGSHKIYVKGLPWVTAEEELRDFFKGCGNITSVELPLGPDGRSSGTAYVRFSKRSELEKALELDGQTWPGTERWLKIQEGFEKPERALFGTGVRPEGCNTVFVGNLPFDIEEDQLREVLGQAGEIERVRFATAEDGTFKGFAHVQFFDGSHTDGAVQLAGTDINGRAIRVDYAPPRNRESFGAPGGGRGGRDGGRGGRDGGRGGRDGGFGRGGRDGGRGGRGGRGTPNTGSKSKGTIAVSAGKKMTFDE